VPRIEWIEEIHSKGIGRGKPENLEADSLLRAASRSLALSEAVIDQNRYLYCLKLSLTLTKNEYMI
jgi:hypothetical protein